MPFNGEKRSTEAKKRPRDKNGHFIPEKPKVKVSGQANLLADLINVKDGDGKGSSWATLTVNHPFEKIIDILRQIKDKQSTTVALKLTIPLIALPIAILMAFQFGRYQSSCSDYFSSQTGTLHNTTIERKVTPDNWFLKAFTYLPFMEDAYSKVESYEQPVLIKDGSDSIVINNEAKIDLDAFIQSKVLVFGNYNSCSKTLTLESAKNISNY